MIITIKYHSLQFIYFHFFVFLISINKLDLHERICRIEFIPDLLKLGLWNFPKIALQLVKT